MQPIESNSTTGLQFLTNNLVFKFEIVPVTLLSLWCIDRFPFFFSSWILSIELINTCCRNWSHQWRAPRPVSVYRWSKCWRLATRDILAIEASWNWWMTALIDWLIDTIWCSLVGDVHFSCPVSCYLHEAICLLFLLPLWYLFYICLPELEGASLP